MGVTQTFLLGGETFCPFSGGTPYRPPGVENFMVRHPSGWVTPTYSGLGTLPDRMAV